MTYLEASANRLGTAPRHVEKDFWVSFVLETLFNRLPEEYPQLLFKGGTSLTKIFNLIRRFSEDVDLVVYRKDLGFAEQQDLLVAKDLSRKPKETLFAQLRAACSKYVLGELKSRLTECFECLTDACRVIPDKADRDQQTLLIEYPTLYPGDMTYVIPRVKVEAGARSALDPNALRATAPYIAEELPSWSFTVDNIRTLAPERTYWEKLLILHGRYYGYQKERRLPTERERISRHYYDVAMITDTVTGRKALSDGAWLAAVRQHNLIAFRSAWKQFDKAVPGSVKLVPPPELREAIEQDYRAMRDMMLGDAPHFAWIMSQLQQAETAINQLDTN